MGIGPLGRSPFFVSVCGVGGRGHFSPVKDSVISFRTDSRKLASVRSAPASGHRIKTSRILASRMMLGFVQRRRAGSLPNIS